MNGVVRRVCGSDVLESDREDLGLIFFFSTRLSQILEGEVSRRIGFCLRSQPSKVNGRKPKQVVINESAGKSVRDLKIRSRKRV